MRLRGATAVLVSAAAGLGGTAAEARAERLLLAAPDAQDLAEQLGEARAATGVCFGWEAYVDAFDGSPSGVDLGSDRGADVPNPDCTRELRLVARITYTSESSEAEDSATVDLVARGLPAPRTQSLLDLAGVEEADLLGDRDDEALFNLAAALPLVAAEADPSLGARLPALERGTLPAGAAVGDRPGSDWWRENGGVLIFGALLALASAYLIASGVRRRRGARRPRSD